MQQPFTEASTNPTPQLTISEEAINYLNETRRWSKFFAILGFIGSAIMILIGLGINFFMSHIPVSQNEMFPFNFTIWITFLYCFIAVIYFIPSFYLLKFAQKLKIALLTKNNEALTEALGNQKSVYKFWGIFMLIFIVIYGLIIAFGLFQFLLMDLNNF